MIWLLEAALTLFGLPPPVPEYQLKAAILYNLAKFVKWPPETNSGNVCVLGEDPFGATLDQTMWGKRLGGRPVLVRRHRDPEDVKGCQILFISSSETRRVEEIIRALGNAGTLTVSEIPDFIERGGMINLLVEHGRIHFRINAAAAKRSGLHISSQLLALAGTAGGREHEE